MSDAVLTNLRRILIDARDFVGKSRCSVGHSVTDVLDYAKPGPLHCVYCKAQAELHEKLVVAISQATTQEPKPPHEREPPHCASCSCHMSAAEAQHHALNEKITELPSELRRAAKISTSGYWAGVLLEAADEIEAARRTTAKPKGELDILQRENAALKETTAKP